MMILKHMYYSLNSFYNKQNNLLLSKDRIKQLYTISRHIKLVISQQCDLTDCMF